jgi:hypothetical protein
MKKPILKRWSENGALRATVARCKRIEKLAAEIASLWGDFDQSNVEHAEGIIAASEFTRIDAALNAQMRAEEA